VPYLTPQELPGDDDCRPLSIPANTEWLALFGGALTELTKVWNWQDSGGLTIAETVEKMQEIIDNWYAVPCAACTTPGGYRVVRIGEDGRVEQLDEDGNWEPATDEYYIPPPEAREGGEPEDQICLAAKNAVNVLEQLYEQLSEDWASTVGTAEALTNLAILATSLIGFEFAPITFGIAAFVFGFFKILYEALEYLGADLWDVPFSDQITCFLVDCANNDAGVVTFDWDCFVGKLNSLADSFELSEVQLRLYAQISYMLWMIGGVDGLNLAGATTAITDDECSCACEIVLYDSCGYGTVENIGGNRWRCTGGAVETYYAVCVKDIEDRCWGYTNIDIIVGGSYADGVGCVGDLLGFPSACDGSFDTGYPSDIVSIYVSGSVPPIFEFDVHCYVDCPPP